MLKNIYILFCLLSVIAKSQTITEFYNKPEKFPNEFRKLSTDYLEAYNSNLLISTYDYSTVDNNTYNIINNYKNIDDINILIGLLTKNCKNDLEKTRAFYIWIINSIVYDLSVRNEYSSILVIDEIAEFTFKKRRAACLEISAIFVLMCKNSGIVAFTLGGYALYDINKTALHAWSSFKYNNNIYFVDATYGLQTLQKNDLSKNLFFNINRGLYKNYYYTTDIYTKLSTVYNGKLSHVVDTRWGISAKEYSSINILHDYKYKNLMEQVLISDTLNSKNPNDIKYFPYFEYESYNILIIKKYATIKKIEKLVSNPNPNIINGFILVRSKEYNKFNKNERDEYNKNAELYYSYIIPFYTKMLEQNKNTVLFEKYNKLLVDVKFDYVYFKSFRK